MNDKKLKILKIIICIVIIIIFPFIFPLLTRLFMHIHLYNDIEEFRNYMNVFFNWHFIIILLIGLIAVYFIICDKDRLINWLEQRDIKFNFKGASIESKANEIIDESDKKKRFVDNFNSNTEIDTKTIKQELNEELKGNNKKKTKKTKDENNIEVLQNENNNLRFYSAYNIINRKTKELLNAIYCEKSMEVTTFKEKLINSFKNRNKKNKNLTKTQINEYANNKYETIKDGLQYLDIIEIRDDETIILTQYGKEFVKKYIENEVGENDN